MTAPFFAPTSFTRGELTLRAYRPGDGPALRVAVTSSIFAILQPEQNSLDSRQ